MSDATKELVRMVSTWHELVDALDDMLRSFGHDHWESVHDAARVDNAWKVLRKAKGEKV